MNCGSRNWSLVILKNGQRGESLPLQAGAVRVGRSPKNEIALPDASVSRHHAEFLSEDAGLTVRDLDSQNGVKVNGVPRKQARLQVGDRVEIGAFLFEIAAAPSTPPPLSLRPKTVTEPALEQTARRLPQLPALRQERHLSTLYHLCFWMAEGADEQKLVQRGLELLLEGFQAEEAQLCRADGKLESWANRAAGKPVVKLAAFLAEKFGAAPEAIVFAGQDIARHQRKVGEYNYLVGPLRGEPGGTGPAPWLMVVRPVDWQEFNAEDRVLMQAVSQLWLRTTAKTRQIIELKQENARLRVAAPAPVLLGKSPAMEALREKARKAAATQVSILLEGETGSGKEVVAQFIHENSPRRERPFVKLNCAAVPEGLIESELFGHVKGAFTDAREDRAGKFAQAHGGTLLLDEIGEMPLPVQAKVLRAIETGEIEPLGAEQVRRVDVRLIAATHRSLKQMVSSRQFREDLYYRLVVVRVPVPALRDHAGDIAELARHFLDNFCAENGLAAMGFKPEACEWLRQHPWPGNVRELRNVIQRCALNATPPWIHGPEVREHLQNE